MIRTLKVLGASLAMTLLMASVALANGGATVSTGDGGDMLVAAPLASGTWVVVGTEGPGGVPFVYVGPAKNAPEGFVDLEGDL